MSLVADTAAESKSETYLPGHASGPSSSGHVRLPSHEQKMSKSGLLGCSSCRTVWLGASSDWDVLTSGICSMLSLLVLFSCWAGKAGKRLELLLMRLVCPSKWRQTPLRQTPRPVRADRRDIRELPSPCSSVDDSGVHVGEGPSSCPSK